MIQKKQSLSQIYGTKKILMNFSLLILLMKFIIIQNIADGIWPGADAENYLKGLLGLNEQGVFSTEDKLTYWPAGYPLFIYSISLLVGDYLFPTLAIIQTLVFSFAIYHFSRNLLQTKLRKFSLFIFLMISFNPTLALSPLTIGYESLATSGFLIALSIIVKDLSEPVKDNFIKYLILNSFIFGFLAFLQPRLIVIGIFMNSLWIIKRRKFQKSMLVALISLLVMLLLPSTLIFRNYQATGIATISTNLGTTMLLGVGDGASGGYLSPNGSGVPCKTQGNESQQDRQKVLCALNWYLGNPGKSLELLFKKTVYFWSPWYGPAFNGTMARNPWLKVNPIRSATENPDGAKLVFGDLGRLISYAWEAFTLFFLLYGLRILWRFGGVERLLGLISGGAIFIALATTWVTLGDNRFRVPIMGMSLFLQAVGIRTLFKGGKPPMVDGPALR
jgi:hypothetical protein